MVQKISNFFKYAPGHYLYKEKYDLMYYPEQRAWEACKDGQLVSAARTRESLCEILDDLDVDIMCSKEL